MGSASSFPEDSSLVVAGATLTVAAAFQPARRRIQQAVDRRFNRRRYDAARTIEAFSDRLRQQVDLNTLTVELLAVVDETMQPTQASLWLRPQALSNAGTATAQRAVAQARGFSHISRSSGTIIAQLNPDGMTTVRLQSSQERQIMLLTCGFAPPAGLEPATLRDYKSLPNRPRGGVQYRPCRSGRYWRPSGGFSSCWFGVVE